MLNFIIHVNELKLKLYYLFFGFILSFITSYIYSLQLLSILSTPFLKFVSAKDSDFIFTHVFEVFATYLTLATFVGLVLNIPVGLYFIFSFIKPGLYNYEKKTLTYLLRTSFRYLVLAFLFTYYLVFPCIFSFFLTLDLIINTDFIILKMETKLYDYVIFLCSFFFIYCFFIFQIPVLLLAFIYVKQPKSKIFYTKRRIWIVFCLFVSCLFSSPDLISLFLIMIPLLVFFELLIILCMLRDIYSMAVRELLEW